MTADNVEEACRRECALVAEWLYRQAEQITYDSPADWTVQRIGDALCFYADKIRNLAHRESGEGEQDASP